MLRILLVDDNPTFLAAVSQVLGLCPGVEVVGQARDGRAALAGVEQLNPDLVLLDIAMPVMNGIEAARHMQLWPRPPRIVFLSSHDGEAYRTSVGGLGAIGFVNKTDVVAELLPIIQNLVAERQRKLV